MAVDTPLLRAAAGFLAPNPGRSFGSALGMAASGLADGISEQKRRELLEQRMAQRTQLLEMQRQETERAQAAAAQAAQRQEQLAAARQSYGQGAQGPMQVGAGTVLAPGQERAPLSPFQRAIAQYQDALRNNDKEYAEGLKPLLQELAPKSMADKVQLRDPVTGKIIAENEASYTPDSPLGAANIQSQIDNRLVGPDGQIRQSVLAAKAAAAPKVINQMPGDKSTFAQVGPMIREEKNRVAGGVKLAESSARMLQALNSGSVLAGPGSSWLLGAAKIGSALGVASKDTQDTITRTRRLIRELAVGAVEARTFVQGQGQITEGEAEAVKKVTSGEIDDLTTDEIRVLAELNIKYAHLLREGYEPMLEVVPPEARPVYNVRGLDSLPDIPQPLGDIEESDFDKALRKYGG